MSITQAAQTIIKLRGRDMTYTVVTVGTYDPTLGSVTNTEKAHKVRGVVVGTSTQRDKESPTQTSGMLDSSPTVSTVVQVLLSSMSGVEPKIGDKLKIATNEYTVSKVRQIEAANGVVVVYDIEGMRS